MNKEYEELRREMEIVKFSQEVEIIYKRITELSLQKQRLYEEIKQLENNLLLVSSNDIKENKIHPNVKLIIDIRNKKESLSQDAKSCHHAIKLYNSEKDKLLHKMIRRERLKMDHADLNGYEPSISEKNDSCVSSPIQPVKNSVLKNIDDAIDENKLKLDNIRLKIAELDLTEKELFSVFNDEYLSSVKKELQNNKLLYDQANNLSNELSSDYYQLKQMIMENKLYNQYVNYAVINGLSWSDEIELFISCNNHHQKVLLENIDISDYFDDDDDDDDDKNNYSWSDKYFDPSDLSQFNITHNKPYGYPIYD